MNNRSERERKWLEEHDRLSRLFKENRLTFERERKHLIDKTINRCRSGTRRHHLGDLQRGWDRLLMHAGSEHNRFVLIQMLFWNQVRDVWAPSLDSYEKNLTLGGKTVLQSCPYNTKKEGKIQR